MMKLTLAFLLIIGSDIGAYGLACIPKQFPDGSVCVCTVNYCDTLENVDLINTNDAMVLSTSEAGLRYQVTHKNLQFSNNINIAPNDGANLPLLGLLPIYTDIVVKRTTTFQKHIGFGGAMTGAVAYLLDMLPTPLRNHIYISYYSSTVGIGYNFLRYPIGGSDFDFAPWAYNELPINDKNLTNFQQLDDRDLLKLKLLREIKTITSNNNIKLVGAAWSSPPYMKSNNDWTGFSCLLSEYYTTWAQYHLKFLQLMADQNETFWAFSTGNEPQNGNIGALSIPFMSLGWTPIDQAKWVGEYLGPLLRSSQFKDVKLLGADDQRFVFPSWFQQMQATNPKSIEYLDGFAVHWYWDDTPLILPEQLDATQALYPDKFIINTESCIGDKPLTEHGPLLGSWARAEQYAASYIEDLNHYVVGWIDWNLVLNETGGPNYVNNNVDSPIIINTTSKAEFYKQPIYYAIGHFSRFILEHSIRIDVTSSNINVDTVGYKRPDNKIVVVLLNKCELRTEVKLYDGAIHINLSLPPKSIHTLLYN